MKDLDALIAERRAQGLYRERLVLDSPQAVEVQVDDRSLVSFCSNDYLGLANHPEVIAALQRGADRYGVGAGASHLITGHSRAHQALEEELADFVQCERALLFSTGYMANLGVIGALAGRRGYVYGDRLNHASLIDGARMARCSVKPYEHLDTAELRRLLHEDSSLAADEPRLITTDAVFSMDGDLAPLPELLRVAQDLRSVLVVDDAHGIGVLGQQGRGSFEHWNVKPEWPAVLVGTLGKAFGTFGAFVAGSASLVDMLIQSARTYIYTTALPPALAEATRASLRLVRRETWRRVHLRKLIIRFRLGAESLGLTLLPSETPIQPLLLGTAERAVAAARSLRAAGFLIPAIRPPTVPAGSARLRITLSAAHAEAHVDRLLDALADLLPADDEHTPGR